MYVALGKSHQGLVSALHAFDANINVAAEKLHVTALTDNHFLNRRGESLGKQPVPACVRQGLHGLLRTLGLHLAAHGWVCSKSWLEMQSSVVVDMDVSSLFAHTMKKTDLP
jgi:hypothetical protein